MKRNNTAQDEAPRFDISSMIDVCFLLLIYFIVTSSIAAPETDLVIALPA